MIDVKIKNKTYKIIDYEYDSSFNKLLITGTYDDLIDIIEWGNFCEDFRDSIDYRKSLICVDIEIDGAVYVNCMPLTYRKSKNEDSNVICAYDFELVFDYVSARIEKNKEELSESDAIDKMNELFG